MSSHRGDLFGRRVGVVGHYLENRDALGRDVDIVVAQILGDVS